MSRGVFGGLCLMLLKHLVEKIGYRIRVRQLNGDDFSQFSVPFTVVGDYDSRHYKVEYDDGRIGAVDKDVGFGRIHFGIFREVFVDGMFNLKEEQCSKRSVLKTSSSTSSPQSSQSSCGSPSGFPSGFLSWCRQLFGCWG